MSKFLAARLKGQAMGKIDIPVDSSTVLINISEIKTICRDLDDKYFNITLKNDNFWDTYIYHPITLQSIDSIKELVNYINE